MLTFIIQWLFTPDCPCKQTICKTKIERMSSFSKLVSSAALSAFAYIKSFDINKGLSPVYEYLFNSEQKLETAKEYKPFATTLMEAKEQYSCVEIESSNNMVGGSENECFVSSENGSNMWGKGGLNIYILREGKKDNINFSLCSNDEVDGKVSFVKNFGPEDQLSFFCSLYKIQSQDINVHSCGEYVYVFVKGEEKTSVVAVELELGQSFNIEDNVNITNLIDVNSPSVKMH
jgi:hypothetical protein